eukprot:890121-Amorphochlora_amoeboformis.AAC.1
MSRPNPTGIIQPYLYWSNSNGSQPNYGLSEDDGGSVASAASHMDMDMDMDNVVMFEGSEFQLLSLLM